MRVFLQAACEEAQPDQPYCQLESYAQQVVLMQGVELPSFGAMQELCVCPSQHAVHCRRSPTSLQMHRYTGREQEALYLAGHSACWEVGLGVLASAW